MDHDRAWAPARLPLAAGGSLLVFSFAASTSGVPAGWAAAAGRPGVAWLEDLSERTIDAVAAGIAAVRRPGDRVIASVHWGANWGYEVSAEEQRFARALVGRAGADLFHGHSSHHAKGIEVFQGKLILYGCGDLINDYEGIGGHEAFRGDLGLMYFPALDAAGRLLSLEMTAMRMRRFRVQRAGEADAHWLAARLEREGRRFGTRVALRADGRLELRS
jgi:poly-gamma-glutamate synthesis protein (capsule biosynthesis protein)